MEGLTSLYIGEQGGIVLEVCEIMMSRIMFKNFIYFFFLCTNIFRFLFWVLGFRLNLNCADKISLQLDLDFSIIIMYIWVGTLSRQKKG